MGVKVLHIWNTAGVASVLAKFMDRDFGTHSSVVTRRAADRVGLTTFGRTYSDGPTRFFLRALLMSRGADLVHVHSLDRVVPWVKRTYGKPVVMHYHGTDIEGRWAEKRPRWSRADFVAVSTPNLLEGAPATAERVANPVDTDVFRPLSGERISGAAVSFRYGMDVEAEAAARRLGLNLSWLDRWSVRHGEMPKTLSRYSYYIDMRKPPGKDVARSLGKAALEALACGCRVVDWAGKVIDRLPEENQPHRVAARWHGIYESLLK